MMPRVRRWHDQVAQDSLTSLIYDPGHGAPLLGVPVSWLLVVGRSLALRRAFPHRKHEEEFRSERSGIRRLSKDPR